MKINLNLFEDAKEFVQEISKVKAPVLLTTERHVVDAKSIMGVFSLNLSEPVEVVVDSQDKTDIMEATKIIKKYVA